MLLADAGTIRDVVLFPTLRPEQDLGSGTMEDGDGPDGGDQPT